MLNQVIGREETKGEKELKMKTIEKRGSICPKRISAGPKGIVAIRASMGAGDFKSKAGSESRRSLLLKTILSN